MIEKQFIKNANLKCLRELMEKYQPTDDGAAKDLRGFEWCFLNNLLNSSSKIAAFRHSGEVWSEEFSPDGKYVYTFCGFCDFLRQSFFFLPLNLMPLG